MSIIFGFSVKIGWHEVSKNPTHSELFFHLFADKELDIFPSYHL